MNDLATTSDESFTADEQVQFDAMRGGAPAPAPEPEPAARPQPEPEARTEPQPEPETDPDEPEADENGENGEAEGNKGQYVRREALRQERERRKGLQKELAEAREARARLDERLRIFSEASQKAAQKPAAEQAPPVDEDPEPNPEEDIFAHNRWVVRQQVRQGEKLQKQLDDFQAAQRAQENYQTYRQDAQRLAQTDPAFIEAYNHLYRSRGMELQHAGMTDPQAIMRQIAQDEFEIATQAIQQGVSPAQRIYEIAKARGFTPKAPEPAPDPAAEAKAAAETAVEKATRTQAGQRGPGRSLSSVGGAPAGGLPTVEQLANMSEEEFNRFAKSNPGAVTALMGG